MRGDSRSAAPRAGRRLAFAGAGVLLGATDTYVVVVVLPSIMSSVGVDLAHLQEATPIISGFLVGYVAALPLLGRLSDLHGRGPVLGACLALFAAGSLVTGSANTLGIVVLGRTLQGAGGGGLVPVTLALVADLWPPRRRGVPLGVVGAVQELGSVVGPLYGAVLTALSGWRAIFYINVPLAALVAAGVRRGPGRHEGRATALRTDGVGLGLAAIAVLAGALAITAPPVLADSVSIGAVFAPLLGDVGLTSPIALVALLAVVGLVVREMLVPDGVRPLLPLRDLPAGLDRLDWPGALLVAMVLACVVVAFASADPQATVVGGAAPALLALAAVLTAVLVRREMRVAEPLIDVRALRGRAVAGALAVNLAVGAALMAALVDIPVFARATADSASQVGAALVLGRLLVAIPVGALIGGVLVSWVGHRAVAGLGMVLSALMFLLMSDWSSSALVDPLAGLGWLHPSDPVLAGCGLGFGLSIVPLTAAVLGAVPPRLHGVAASLTVASRMVGMLAGVSLLTAVGLRRFYSVQAMLPNPASLCPRSPLNCAAYNSLEAGAIVDELHTVFVGAALCALLAALLALALLGGGDRGGAGVVEGAA